MILRILRVFWTLLVEPILFAAGFALGIAFGLITLCFEALMGLVYLALLPLFIVGPLILFLYFLFWLGQQR